MAGYHPDYLHDDRARTGSGSPLTPFSPTQPPSFKTNVNRKKTKRWVNAKTYTYDGDDWGDSGDDDAADADSDPRQSHAPSVPEDRDGLGKPPARFPEPTNRSSSASSVTRRQIPAGAARFQTEQMSVPNYQEDNSPKPLPFVRPADIYKRLSEEREKQRMKVAEASRASHESDRHSEAASAQHVPPLTQRNALQRPTFPQDRSEQISSPNHSFDNTPQPPSGSADGSQRFAHATNPIDTPKTTNKDDKATDLPQVTIDNPPGLEPFTTPDQVAKLPELRRLSDFADDFMNPAGGQPVQDSRAAQETSAEPSSQTSELDRNRSLGFRSVVHQAFDVPDTPTTDTGSIARSDSNTTSLISPIIRSNTMSFAAENRAPTIQEEPVEQDVQNVASRSQTPPVLGFKPGHRRSLTPPNSNNSPARRPVVTAGEPMFRSESARTLDASSAESKYRPDSDTTQTQAEPSIKSHHSAAEAAKDAAPSYQQSNESESAKNHQQTPQPPTLDTRPLPPETRVSPSSADPSSANELNDRLRDEIIRSLTPSSSIQAEDAQPLTSSNVGHEPRSRIRHESTLIPSAYDSYWNEQSGLSFSSSPVSPVDPSACTNPQINAEQNSPLPQAREGEEMLQPLDRNPDTTSNVAHPPLKKKFSWEMDSEEDEPAPSADEPQPKPQISVVGPTTQMPIATDTIRKVEDTDSNFPQGHVFEHADRRSSVMTGADPATPVAEEVLSDPCPKSPKEPLATLSPSDDAKLLPEHGPSGPSVNAPAVDSEKLLGFREIMSLKTSNQKIAAFNRTREQFAATDTGLQDWLRQAAENLSEHADLVQRNGELPPGSSISHKSTTSRSKFPILSSGSGPSRTHIRHASGTPLSSMMHSQQVQAKGKDLLHSAGVLGGKAGDAAKGLFAKGRNKFRHSGSADKDHDQESSTGSHGGPRVGITSHFNPAKGARETHKPQGDIPRLRSLKLDQSPIDVSFDSKMPPRRSSLHALPEDKRALEFFNGEKVRSMSSPAQDRSVAISTMDQYDRPTSSNDYTSPGQSFSGNGNHVLSTENTINLASPAGVGSGLLSLTSCGENTTSSISVHETQALEEKINESFVPQHYESQSSPPDERSVPVSVASATPVGAGSLKLLGAISPPGSISRELSKSSKLSNTEQALILTPNGLELTSDPQFTAGAGTFPVKNVPTSEAYGVSKPPSPSPPEETIAKGVGEHIISRKFSFEEEGSHNDEVERQLVAGRYKGDGSAFDTESTSSMKLHQPYPVKIGTPLLYPGSTPNYGYSTGPIAAPRPSHARYFSVPTTHPAHHGFETAKRMSVPSNGVLSTAMPTQTQGSSRPVHQNSVPNAIPPTANSSQASQASTPPRSRSRLSALFSRFSSSHSKTNHTPLSQPQQQPLQPLPNVQAQPVHNGLPQPSSTIRTPHDTLSNRANMPPGDKGRVADDSKKSKGLRFLRRFSYNGHTENVKKFTPMGIKPAEKSPKSLKTTPKPPLALSVNTEAQPVQGNPSSLHSQTAHQPRAGRFYQSLNSRLSNITESPTSEPPATSSSRTSTHSQTFNGRYHNRPNPKTRYSIGGDPVSSSSSITGTPSIYSSHYGSHGSTSGKQERYSIPAQSVYPYSRNTSLSGQSDANRSTVPQNYPSSTASRPATLYSTGSTPQVCQQPPMNFTFSQINEARSTNNKSSTSSRTIEPSQYPLPESRVLSPINPPINPAATQLPPPPPPKIPLAYANPSATAPSPARISPAPTSQQLGNDSSLSFSDPTPPAIDTLQPPHPYFARRPHDEPAELSTHDDSSEEIVMSGTSYPGQEWQPSSLGNWD